LNLFELILVEDVLRQVLENLLCITQGRVQALGSIDNEEGVLSGGLLVSLENLGIVDVRHLSSKLPYGELGVSI